MILTRQAILAEAMEWLGTPYHHCACVKGIGVDCAMFFVGIAKALGTLSSDWEPPFYTPQWHLHQKNPLYTMILEKVGCVPISIEASEPGDIVVFRWEPWQPASHGALLLPQKSILHARHHPVPGRGKVRREPFAAYQRYIAGAYAWPGVI